MLSSLGACLLSFIKKIHKELGATDSDSTARAKCQTSAKCPNTNRTLKFV